MLGRWRGYSDKTPHSLTFVTKDDNKADLQTHLCNSLHSTYAYYARLENNTQNLKSATTGLQKRFDETTKKQIPRSTKQAAEGIKDDLESLYDGCAEEMSEIQTEMAKNEEEQKTLLATQEKLEKSQAANEQNFNDKKAEIEQKFETDSAQVKKEIEDQKNMVTNCMNSKNFRADSPVKKYLTRNAFPKIQIQGDDFTAKVFRSQQLRTFASTNKLSDANDHKLANHTKFMECCFEALGKEPKEPQDTLLDLPLTLDNAFGISITTMQLKTFISELEKKENFPFNKPNSTFTVRDIIKWYNENLNEPGPPKSKTMNDVRVYIVQHVN